MLLLEKQNRFGEKTNLRDCCAFGTYSRHDLSALSSSAGFFVAGAEPRPAPLAHIGKGPASIKFASAQCLVSPSIIICSMVFGALAVYKFILTGLNQSVLLADCSLPYYRNHRLSGHQVLVCLQTAGHLD